MDSNIFIYLGPFNSYLYISITWYIYILFYNKFKHMYHKTPFSERKQICKPFDTKDTHYH